MNEGEGVCSICLGKNIGRWAVYQCGHWNCLSCYDSMKEKGQKECPLCRAELVLDHKENITQRKKPCLLCDKESPESVAFYQCGHSNCLKCFDLLLDFRVGTCPICPEPLQIRWIEGNSPIFVNGFTAGLLFTLYVNLDRTTGQHLENIVYYLLGFHSGRLIYAGQQILPVLTLSEAKLTAYSTVFVNTRMRGD